MNAFCVSSAVLHVMRLELTLYGFAPYKCSSTG